MLFKLTSSILYGEQASISKEASNNFYNEILAQHLPQEHISQPTDTGFRAVLFSSEKRDWFPHDCNVTTCKPYFLQVFFFQKVGFVLFSHTVLFIIAGLLLIAITLVTRIVLACNFFPFMREARALSRFL